LISQFQAKMRDEKRKAESIATYLKHLRAAFRWAAARKWLPEAPRIDLPKRTKGARMMRGRPITGEEFDRLLLAVPKVRPADADAWVHYLRGLWLSGLRLEESTIVSWDADAPFAIDLTGRRPMFRIYAEAQKARRDELLPMTPDFAEFILQTPEDQRQGRLFKLDNSRTGQPLLLDAVSHLVSDIGETAGVVIDKAAGTFATAHDLRRAFGTRWASRVKPAVLQRLMRHKDIATTMKYYVALDADDIADELWEKHAGVGTSVGTCQNPPPRDAANDSTVNEKTPCGTRGSVESD
jgi:integrase